MEATAASSGLGAPAAAGCRDERVLEGRGEGSGLQSVAASRIVWWEGMFGKLRSRAPRPSFFRCAMKKTFCRTAGN
jgi:hypothetical protein